MTLLCNGRNKIGTNDENSVPCGSLSHFLVLDRFGSYQKKFELQHQMEPNLCEKKTKILNIHFALSNET